MNSLLQKIEERRKNKKIVQKSHEIQQQPRDEPQAPIISEEPSVKKQKLNDQVEEEKINDVKAIAESENFTIIKSLDFKKVQKVIW